MNFKDYISKEEKIEERVHERDDVLGAITVGELVDTVHANIENPTEKDVMNTYQELLKIRMDDAKHDLKANMKEIMKMIKG